MINLLQFEYMLHEKLLEVFVGEVDTHLFKARTTTATRKLHVANANRSRALAFAASKILARAWSTVDHEKKSSPTSSFCSQRISAISALDVSRRCALQIYILLYLLTY